MNKKFSVTIQGDRDPKPPIIEAMKKILKIINVILGYNDVELFLKVGDSGGLVKEARDTGIPTIRHRFTPPKERSPVVEWEATSSDLWTAWHLRMAEIMNTNAHLIFSGNEGTAIQAAMAVFTSMKAKKQKIPIALIGWPEEKVVALHMLMGLQNPDWCKSFSLEEEDLEKAAKFIVLYNPTSNPA